MSRALTVVTQQVQRTTTEQTEQGKEAKEETAAAAEKKPETNKQGAPVELDNHETAVLQPKRKTRLRKEENAVRDLIEMLGTKRPHSTAATLTFAQKWLKPLGARPDKYGNWHLKVQRPDKTDSSVLWSSHIDTVHYVEGEQRVAINAATGMVRLHEHEKASCLGADCTTGVWMMREMVLARVPGYYIWHEAEEAGGRGSRYAAKHFSKRFKAMKAAIAFDRKGYNDVITYQSGGRCASNEFALSLAAQLPGKYVPDMTGVFTDTANYTHLIAECTNISVGYFDQHTSREYQDVVFAVRLREAMLSFDEDKLVIQRKPGEGGYSRYGSQYGSYMRGGGGYDREWWKDYGYDYGEPEYRGYGNHAGTTGATSYGSGRRTMHQSSSQSSNHETVKYLVKPCRDPVRKCGGLCDGHCIGLCSSQKANEFKTMMDMVDQWNKDHNSKHEVKIEVTWADDPETGRGYRKYAFMVDGVEQTMDALMKAVGQGAEEPDDSEKRICKSMMDFVTTYPDAVVAILEEWGLNLQDLYASYTDLL